MSERVYAVSDEVLEKADAIMQTLATLEEFYTPSETRLWLTLPNEQFGGRVPINMLVVGDGGDVLASLRRMADGVYL